MKIEEGVPGEITRGETIFLLSFVGLFVLVAAIFFFCGVVYPALRDMRERRVINNLNKRMLSCHHLYRCRDIDYTYSNPTYVYQCEKCKKVKNVSESNKEHFEKHFLSDYDEFIEKDN